MPEALLAGADEGESTWWWSATAAKTRTAEVARQVAPMPRCWSSRVASKVAALNAGDGVARYFPRFYVDADVELPIAAVRHG